MLSLSLFPPHELGLLWPLEIEKWQTVDQDSRCSSELNSWDQGRTWENRRPDTGSLQVFLLPGEKRLKISIQEGHEGTHLQPTPST